MVEKEIAINGRVLKEQELNRYQKLQKLLSQKYDVYGRKWPRNYNSATLKTNFAVKTKAELELIARKAPHNQIIIAGRLMLKRVMGKAAFAQLQDQDGEFQIYVNQNDVPEKEFSLFNDADLGDIFGVEGKVMRSNKGELTVRVYHLVLLAKALRPLADKWHGISNMEERYRRRYLDLIINPEVKNVFIKRTQVFNYLRDFLNEKGYLEVETPILQEIYGGAAAKPFTTHHNSLKMDLYLRIATELHLKRLIVGGFEGVYEIGRVFRNEGVSPKHNPEFTTLELYVAYQDMNFMMNLTEECIKNVVNKVHMQLILETKIRDGDTLTTLTIDLAKPWRKVKMLDAIKDTPNKAFQLDFKPVYDLVNEYDQSHDEEEIKVKKALAYQMCLKIATKYEINIDKHHNSVGHLINLFFEHFVEPTLIEPTFIYHYPVEISPLAKLSATSTNFTDRFELFIARREYANAYSELNDPIQQYERFQDQIAEKIAGNEEATADIDYDFVEALEFGMPPTAGLGIGLDRLVMLITGQDSIKDVLLFPQLKAKKKL